MRDAQRSVVYRAESRAMAHPDESNACSSVEQAARFLQRVVSSAWWKKSGAYKAAAGRMGGSAQQLFLLDGSDRNAKRGFRAWAGVGAVGAAELARHRASRPTPLGNDRWLVGELPRAKPDSRHMCHRIRLRGTLSNVLLLHELAHRLVPRHASGHGREWRQWYLKLVKRWVPVAHTMLREGFRARKLKLAPKRPRQMSEAQREMLRERMRRINAERGVLGRAARNEQHDWKEDDVADDWDGFGQFQPWYCDRCGRTYKLRPGSGRVRPAPGVCRGVGARLDAGAANLARRKKWPVVIMAGPAKGTRALVVGERGSLGRAGYAPSGRFTCLADNGVEFNVLARDLALAER